MRIPIYVYSQMYCGDSGPSEPAEAGALLRDLPVGKDSKLDGVTGGCQHLFILLSLHLNPDICVGGDKGCALGLDHNGADLIQQDGRPRNAMTRLELL